MPLTRSLLSYRRNGRSKALNLGLQGGGAHGAFTWGVLDALLAEDGLRSIGMMPGHFGGGDVGRAALRPRSHIHEHGRRARGADEIAGEDKLRLLGVARADDMDRGETG